MKIVFLQDDFPPYHVGGGGIIAYRLAKEFARLNHKVIVITTVQHRSDVGRESLDGVDVIRLYSNYHPRFRSYKSLYNPAVVHDIRQLLKEYSPDIVHAHNVHTHLSYYSLILARQFGGKVVMTEHDAMSFHFGKLPSATDPISYKLPSAAYRESFFQQLRKHRWRYNPLRTWIILSILHKNVDATIAVSEALKQALEENGIRTHMVIHNGINVSEWVCPTDIGSFKKKHGLKNKVIFFGGRISEPKGAMQMIEALTKIRKVCPDVQLLIVGKYNTSVEHMKEFAMRQGVDKNLVFAGWLNGTELICGYYSACVVVVPSIYLDPFPTVSLEAFATMKPVVATCFGGANEVVEDGVSGYVVNPLNIEELSEKITDLLIDEEKANRFGVVGYERVIRDFTLEKQACAYIKLFSELN